MIADDFVAGSNCAGPGTGIPCISPSASSGRTAFSRLFSQARRPGASNVYDPAKVPHTWNSAACRSHARRRIGPPQPPPLTHQEPAFASSDRANQAGGPEVGGRQRPGASRQASCPGAMPPACALAGPGTSRATADLSGARRSVSWAGRHALRPPGRFARAASTSGPGGPRGRPVRVGVSRPTPPEPLHRFLSPRPPVG